MVYNVTQLVTAQDDTMCRLSYCLLLREREAYTGAYHAGPVTFTFDFQNE